jgi:hypothetical protein
LSHKILKNSKFLFFPKRQNRSVYTPNGQLADKVCKLKQTERNEAVFEEKRALA